MLQLQSAAALDEADLMFVNAVANQLAIALARQAGIDSRQGAAEEGQAIARIKQARAEEATRAVQASQARYQALVNASAQIVWMADSSGAMVEDSPSRREFTGQTFEQMKDFGWLDAIHPDDRERVGRLWRRAVAEHTPLKIEFRTRRASGDWRWMSMRAVPVLAGDESVREWVGMNSDFTERKQAEEALRKSEAWQRLIFESVKDFAIFSLNEHGKVMDWNAGAERLFGYDSGEMLGQSGALVFTPEDRAAGVPEHEMQAATKAGFAEDERWHLRKNGERFFASGTMRPLRDEAGKLLGFVKVARDITERQRAAERLAEEDRRKNEFMAMLAHELRNPLTPIKSAAQILRMAKIDHPTVVRVQEIVERQANHMVRLVDDLLDISRLQSGKVRLKREVLNLAQAVSEAVEACNHLIVSHNHELTLDLQGDPPLFIDADPARVVQIVANIVGNAAKYTPNHGIIHVAAAAEEGMAVVRVRDNGAGIAPDMLGRIFDVYTQVEQSLDRSQGGLGLGLKLVRELVLLHGGTVQASSAGLGKGSEFILKFPLAVRASGAGGAGAAAEAGKARKEREKPHAVRHILLVEDNADIRDAMELLLTMQGHQVELADDGPEGIRKALAGRPDVAFIDIGLPGLNGYEVAKEIRAGYGCGRIVLIALTGYGQAEDKQRALQAGFAAHLTKPADAEDLFEILSELEKYHRA